MIVLANVIFPAFATPYVSALLFPAAAVAAIVTEVIIFRLLNRNLTWGRIFMLVLVMNIISAAIGFAIAAVLPDGLVPTMMGDGEHQFELLQPGPKFGTYATLGYILAFVLSILIEWIVVLTFRPRIGRIDKPFKTVALANVASYLVLIAVVYVWSNFFW